MPEGKIYMKTHKESLDAKHHIFVHSDHIPNTVISKSTYKKDVSNDAHAAVRTQHLPRKRSKCSFASFIVHLKLSSFAIQSTKKITKVTHKMISEISPVLL